MLLFFSFWPAPARRVLLVGAFGADQIFSLVGAFGTDQICPLVGAFSADQMRPAGWRLRRRSDPSRWSAPLVPIIFVPIRLENLI